MKKLTYWILGTISTVGTFLVAEGVLTGEELSAIQNVSGLALAGGGISIGLIIAIIQALPKQLVSEGYNKAVEKYGQAKVDGVFNKFDEFVGLLQTVDTKLDNVQASLDKAEQTRQDFLNE